MTPDTFASALTARLGPAYRLRRAIRGPRWCIEQKVKRGDWLAPPMGDPDQQVRAREGYHLVLTCEDDASTHCPRCTARLSLPLFEHAEFSCPACIAAGERSSLKGGYFPLVDRTLLHLEATSPRRGRARDIEMDARNRAAYESKLRDARNLAEDLASDAWRRIAGVSQFAYNSRTGTPNQYGSDTSNPYAPRP